MKILKNIPFEWSIQKFKLIPQQLRHLFVVFIILMVIFIIVRHILIPTTFGEYGHYRAAAVDSVMNQNLLYAGYQACVECHDDVVEVKYKSFHRNVSCETCHGAAYNHIQAPDEYELAAPRERGYCGLCHNYNPSRPTGFPQIDPVTHNPLKACMSCHNPHAPKLPHKPEECSACHAEIARTKSVSHHQALLCTKCHETKEEHKATPREYLPSVPQTREFCGQCHALDSNVGSVVSRVDLSTHGENYTCWQCHYPHYPEAYR